MRLDVPSGQSVRFEAGDELEVGLVELGGLGQVIGFNNLLDGSTSSQAAVRQALERAAALGFAGMRDWARQQAEREQAQRQQAEGDS
jgi:hypothetical protein